MKEKQLISYLKNSFYTSTFKTVVVSASTIIFLPLIIQKVGMETYGLISLTMIFGGMVVFVDFGIAKSVTLLIGKDNKKSNVNTNFSSAILINFLILILIAVVLIFLVYFNVPILGKQLQITDHLKNYIVFVGFLLLVLMLLNNLMTAVLEAYYLMHYINVGFTLSAIGLNIFLYITSLLTDSLYILLMAPVVSFLLVSLFFINIIRRHTNVRLTKPNKDQVKSILSVSYKFFNIGLVNSLMIPANKYLLIYLTGSSTILGIFDIGLKIAMIANNFLNSIAQPLFGVFANIKNKKSRIFKIATNTSLLIFLFYIIGNILFYFTGKYITIFIDINHHEELFLIGMILLVGVTFSSVSEPFYRALLGTERLNEALYLKLLLPLFNLIFYLYLSNYNDLEKITYSYTIAVFLSSFIIILYYVKSHKRIFIK
jgi:O-antigen/teichoic acid export membrane protein